jgi:hypothetical protein
MNKYYLAVKIMANQIMRMTVSLAKEEISQLKKIAKEEKRLYSRQVIYMMEFYIKNKNKIRH